MTEYTAATPRPDAHDAVDLPQDGEDRVPRLRRLRRVWDRGASLIEYAMLIALIALVCLAAVTRFGGNNQEGINRSADSIYEATNG